jgi:hypothetical protein
MGFGIVLIEIGAISIHRYLILLHGKVICQWKIEYFSGNPNGPNQRGNPKIHNASAGPRGWKRKEGKKEIV